MMASVLALGFTAATHFQHDPTAQARMKEGKNQLDKLIGDHSTPGCWASAVEDLKAGCRAMDDVQRSHLAVKVRSSANGCFYICIL